MDALDIIQITVGLLVITSFCLRIANSKFILGSEILGFWQTTPEISTISETEQVSSATPSSDPTTEATNMSTHQMSTEHGQTIESKPMTPEEISNSTTTNKHSCEEGSSLYKVYQITDMW